MFTFLDPSPPYLFLLILTVRDCTSYSGTSASCPLAAGVMALALEAHPNATWLELQYMVVESTFKHNDRMSNIPAKEYNQIMKRLDPSWIKNAAGFWHSNNMGFGLLDAYRLVQTAERWKVFFFELFVCLFVDSILICC